MVRLSIVVPVYNVEKYLERCIDSLYNQDIPTNEYEVIVVDDGSTDESLSIAKHCLVKHSNMSVIEQENQGLSGARNAGIKNSIGSYLWFVDSDDYIASNCLKTLLQEAEKYNVDLYAFREKKVISNTKQPKIHCKQELPLNCKMSGTDAIMQGFKPCSVCSFLLSTKFVLTSNLFFTLGITHEDVDYTIKAICLAHSIVFTEHVPYIYEYNPHSLSVTKVLEHRKKYMIDDVKVASLVTLFAIEQKEPVKNQLIKMANSIICGLLFHCLLHKSTWLYLQDILEVAVKNELYPIKRPLLTWKQNLMSYLLNCSYLFKYVSVE
jgi:glycosyltransferase involved in cell wall biosynthesis